MIFKENKVGHVLLPATCWHLSHYCFDTQGIISHMHNYLYVSANVCTNVLLIMHSVDSAFLILALTLLFIWIFPFYFSTWHSKLNVKQILIFTFSFSRVSLLRHKENAHWNLSKIIRIGSDLNSRWCSVKAERELWLCFKDSHSFFASYRFKCIVYSYKTVDFFIIRLPASSVVFYWKAVN